MNPDTSTDPRIHAEPEVARWRADTNLTAGAAKRRREYLRELLAGFGLRLVEVPPGQPIPGSYWGDDEAGLTGDVLYARADTPVHSILHEACHFLCMDAARRAKLDTDAGGDYAEENAVCYLQILLADRIDGYNAAACMRDMDEWGYSFRLGSARAWFERDAEDALAWLEREKGAAWVARVTARAG